MVYAFLRDRYATPRHPLTPWAATPRTQSLFHPFFDVGGKTTVRVAKRKRSGRGAEEGEGKGWRRCHCTALGEGHYSEQGEPVTSAPTPGIDPTPSAALPLPPPPVCRVWHGVQCTVRFSTFIILARCVHAPTEGTRYCYLFGAVNVASLCWQIFSHWPCFRSVNLGFFNLFGAALVRRVVSFWRQPRTLEPNLHPFALDDRREWSVEEYCFHPRFVQSGTNLYLGWIIHDDRTEGKGMDSALF